MGNLRAFLLGHRRLALLLVAAALCLKVLVPGGYMLGQGAGTYITVEICADASGQHLTKDVFVPAKPGQGNSAQAKGDGPCPYSALSMAALSGADAALLALALAFILALGFLPAAPPRLARAAHVRPPLRGPPAFA
jgi:hypothetical protein